MGVSITVPAIAETPQKIAILTKKAEDGNVDAQFVLGAGYYQQQDYVKAKYWLEKAALQGDAMAQFSLGVLYEYGQGVPKDYVKAKQWYEKAAAQGNAHAQYLLGDLYRTGRGVPQDYIKAKQLYEKSAEQGYPLAQFNLGGLYYLGLGVPKDYVKAKKYYKQACDNGSSSGCDILKKLQKSK